MHATSKKLTNSSRLLRTPIRDRESGARMVQLASSIVVMPHESSVNWFHSTKAAVTTNNVSLIITDIKVLLGGLHFKNCIFFTIKQL